MIGEETMRGTVIYSPLKLLGWVVILLMLVASGYAAYISIRYWSGIGV
jgi:hypothetical protein